MRARFWFASLLIPVAAVAGVEVTPQLGYGSGGFDIETGIACIQAPCPSYAESESGPLYGAILGVPLSEVFQFEVLVNRQASELAFRDGRDLPRNAVPGVDLDVTHLHAGLQRLWKLKRFEPFVAGGLGRTWIDSPFAVLDGIDLERWSGSLAGGARIPLDASDRYAVRLEARGYLVDMPEERVDNNYIALDRRLTQLETTVGLSFRF